MTRRIAAFATLSFALACTPAAPPAPPAPATGELEPSPATSAPTAFPTEPPEPGPAPTLRLPTPIRRQLSNGLSVMYVRHGDVPLVHATLITRGGTAEDPAGLAGVAEFTAEMLDEGAGGRSALELSAALDLLGASLRTDAGWDAARVDLDVLRNRLPDALAIMADVVARPDFPADEVERVRNELLTSLAAARDEPRAIAANAYASLLFGDQHPYGRLVTTETAGRFDRAVLTDFHQSWYRPGASTLILVGDVDADQMHAAVEQAFGDWDPGAAVAPAEPPAPRGAETRIYLIDKPGAEQSEIRVGNPGVARDNPDYFPLVVMNTVLGGSFTSRLNMNLREEHGYSYGAGSSFDMRRGIGPFTAASAVVTAKTDSAVIEFFNELEGIRSEPVPTDELERAKNYVALGLPRAIETAGDLASQLAELEIYGLPADFYDSYVSRIMEVTAEDVQRIANRYIQPDQAVVVIVGDRETIEPGLRALGLGPVEVRGVEEFVR